MPKLELGHELAKTCHSERSEEPLTISSGEGGMDTCLMMVTLKEGRVGFTLSPLFRRVASAAGGEIRRGDEGRCHARRRISWILARAVQATTETQMTAAQMQLPAIRFRSATTRCHLVTARFHSPLA